MLIRTIIFFIALIAAAMGVDKLANQPGVLVMNWHGWHIETTAAFFVVCLGLLLLLAFLVIKTYMWLDLLPRRLSQKLQRNRQEKGFTALSDSMTALAVGDHNKALKQARNAKKALPNLPLADAMLAQASATTAQGSNTAGYYNKLLDNPHTNLAGLKGLLLLSLSENESQRALTYAEDFYTKAPQNLWIMEVLTDLYARQSRYEDAAQMAGKWRKQVGKKDESYEKACFLEACNRLEAARENIRLADAGGVEAQWEGVHKKAEKEVERLLKDMPGFVPAALFLSEQKEKNGNGDKHALKAARRVLQNAYHKVPHHSLADRWLELMRADRNDALKKQPEKFADKFTGPWQEHILGMTVKGKTLLQVRQWSEAHKVLAKALLKGEDRTLFETLAKLEQAQHPDGGGAARWLQRALYAPDLQHQHDGYSQSYQNWRKSLVRSMASGTLPHADMGGHVAGNTFQFTLPAQLEDKSTRE